MYDEEVDVPDEAYSIPFGEANVTREGEDVTIIAFGRMVNYANAVADKLSKEGITCTVVDPRTTSPLDTETILETAAETGRVVVVDEAHPRCSMATDVTALIAQEAFDKLKAPIRMVTAPHCAGAVLGRARGPLHPEPGQDRGRGARGDGGAWRGQLTWPTIQTIVMPKWGLAMQEGMVAAWHVNVGDTVAKGQEIMDIETSKIANVFESPAAGKLRRRLVDAGETVPVGALLGVVADDAGPGRRDRRLRRRVPGASSRSSSPRWRPPRAPSPRRSRSAAGACAT